MGKKKSPPKVDSDVKVGPPTQSKKKSPPKVDSDVKVGPPTQSKKKSQPTPSKSSPKVSETATATVERIFGGARNKFLAKQAAQAGSKATTSAPTPEANSTAKATATPSTPSPKPLPSGSNGDSAAATIDEESASEPASDIDGHAFSGLGSLSDSGSESDTDTEASPKPAGPSSTKGKGKQKENNVPSGSSSKVTSDSKSASSKLSGSGKLARFGQLVFVPIVPVVLPGSKLPTLPLPTPHEVRSLRAAMLGAVPPPNQSTFAIESNASNSQVNRYFRKILPKPFKAIGKTAPFHLMYSHGNTLGGCGTDSPTGFDIATAYRAGKANNQKVLYLAPTEPIAEAKIKTWELDAVVKGIKLRMEGKKRKRSARDDSESEDESDKSSSNESEAGTDSDATGDSNRTGDDDGPKGFVDEDDEVTSPPRKKIKLDPEASPSMTNHRTTSPKSPTTAPSPPNTTEQVNSPRVLRDRNRIASAPNSKGKSKAVDPLNPWLNASSYAL